MSSFLVFGIFACVFSIATSVSAAGRVKFMEAVIKSGEVERAMDQEGGEWDLKKVQHVHGSGDTQTYKVTLERSGKADRSLMLKAHRDNDDIRVTNQ